MKIWLKENWFKAAIILLVLVISIFFFYWFGWRPAKIKEDCSQEAVHQAIEKADKAGIRGERYLPEDYNNYYNRCLRGRGL